MYKYLDMEYDSFMSMIKLIPKLDVAIVTSTLALETQKHMEQKKKDICEREIHQQTLQDMMDNDHPEGNCPCY